MKKWTRCIRCSGWIKPEDESCLRCERILAKSPHVEPYGDPTYAQLSREHISVPRLAVLASPRAPVLVTCAACEVEFDPADPKHQKGKHNECGDCAGEDVTRLTGVMIVGGKNAMEIQINADPEVTRYMQSASAHYGTAPAVVASKKAGSVVKVVTGLENRRHG